jgi:hypothetical protein
MEVRLKWPRICLSCRCSAFLVPIVVSCDLLVGLTVDYTHQKRERTGKEEDIISYNFL